MRENAALLSNGPHAANVIFEGHVENQDVISGNVGAANAMSLTTEGRHRIVTLTVVFAHKGIAPGRVKVLTGMGDSDCGFDFEKGKDYLVFAERVADGTLFTSICSGTASLEDSGPDVRYLRGKHPEPDDLLDPPAYYTKHANDVTANVCGHVTKTDGTPVASADVTLIQMREEEDLPPRSASDPNLSKKDGSFCVPHVEPGKYIMTAETINYKKNKRLAAYYPGVAERSQAQLIEVLPSKDQVGRDFLVREEPLFTVRFRVVTEDGSPLPVRTLGIYIHSLKRDPLGYEERHGVENDGSYTLGLIPSGHYVVGTYFDSDYDEKTGQPRQSLEAKLYTVAQQEVDIASNEDVVIKISRRQKVKSPAHRTPRNKSRQLLLTADGSVAVEQHAFHVLFSHRAIEELLAFEEDFDERRTRGKGALDERL
jgi:hypothetical protein